MNFNKLYELNGGRKLIFFNFILFINFSLFYLALMKSNGFIFLRLKKRKKYTKVLVIYILQYGNECFGMFFFKKNVIWHWNIIGKIKSAQNF